MKQLKFAEPLPRLILDGSKKSTWRINDKKNIIEGDDLSLCFNNKIEFAKAIVTDITETTFGELTAEDKKGHESFTNDKEMYTTYSNYYNTKVTSETNLKIIRFRLV